MQKTELSSFFFSKKRLENLVVSQKSYIFAEVKMKSLNELIKKRMNLPYEYWEKNISFFSG